jgi:DNA-binding transcriptional MerR regulator
VRYLKTSEAATLLNVSPNTLRAWERRFGFPRPQRSEGRHRMYTHGEILALRDALRDGLSISSAISRAREGLVGDRDSLLAALQSFDTERADAAMEGALALRSLERAVEDLLLPSLVELLRRQGPDSAVWALASDWGVDWLRRARRVGSSLFQAGTILFADATGGTLDPDTAPLLALELMCARQGLKVMTLAAAGAGGLADALAAHPPDIVVISGGHVEDDAVARWAYAARASLGARPLAIYRRGKVRAGPRGTRTLPPAPGQACERLLELLQEAPPAARPRRRQVA